MASPQLPPVDSAEELSNYEVMGKKEKLKSKSRNPAFFSICRPTIKAAAFTPLKTFCSIISTSGYMQSKLDHQDAQAYSYFHNIYLRE